MANLYDYNTSSAYKLDYNYLDRQRKEKLNKEKELHDAEQKQRKAMAAKKLRERRIKALIAVVALFVMSFVVVNRYVEINEAQNKVNELQSQYNSIMAENQALQAKIDKAVDLKKLQTVASEKFGMVRPERYQMFYIDMQQCDMCENVAQEKTGNKKEKCQNLSEWLY